jgi:Pyridoxamine 5'-phosphate oxidase
MDRQGIDDELSTAGAQELLASTSAAHLAYTAKDGTPRVIPVGFFWTGDQFVISSATASPKVTALSARPDIALAIDAGDTPDQARALSVRGRASRSSMAWCRNTSPLPGRRWTPKRRPSSNGRSAGCTTRWRASRSRRSGYASGISAPAGCRDSCRNSPNRTNPDSGPGPGLSDRSTLSTLRPELTPAPPPSSS